MVGKKCGEMRCEERVGGDGREPYRAALRPLPCRSGRREQRRSRSLYVEQLPPRGRVRGQCGVAQARRGHQRPDLQQELRHQVLHMAFPFA